MARNWIETVTGSFDDKRQRHPRRQRRCHHPRRRPDASV